MSSTTSHSAALSQVTNETRCKYRSKWCEFPRSVKRNGELHRFCDYHRMKANLNQRRVDRRRKLKFESNICTSASPQDSDVVWYEDLSPKDLEYLDYLLSSGEADKILDGDKDLTKQYGDAFSAAFHYP
ncbi:hypothetical protein PHYBOEH_008029 [Phytophthora boehmeriae]|uniref:Uncharacterized protein n=1 Tax=Phytophthora boehmeriae TaxID=109152 RepID=A0A8T1W715_9STRA|nr:hypothetical protein PHYBOEH_008029 [Phytophthora boehmeriae]